MANRVDFELAGKSFHMTAPSALQLGTFTTIIESYYMRKTFYAGMWDPKEIVDVGACIGTMTLAYHVLWPEASILALEPHPLSYDHLTANCHGIGQVECLKLAASDREEEFRIALPAQEQRPDVDRSGTENVGMASRFGRGEDYAALVYARPLDEIAHEPDLIKIDVEGMELEVLEGARGVIEAERPLIQIEIRPVNQKMAGRKTGDISEWLRARGYQYVGKLMGDILFAHEGKHGLRRGTRKPS